jgi:single-strand DNA-binding protein
MDLNKVFLIGRISSDIELKTTQSGQSVASISVATNRTWKDSSGKKQEQAEFHKVVIWGKRAELVAQYMAKGALIYIEGHLQTRSWQAQDGGKRYSTEIVADQVQFGPRPGGAKPMQAGVKPTQKVEGMDEDGLPIIDDDAPRGTGPEINVEDIPF